MFYEYSITEPLVKGGSMLVILAALYLAWLLCTSGLCPDQYCRSETDKTMPHVSACTGLEIEGILTILQVLPAKRPGRPPPRGDWIPAEDLAKLRLMLRQVGDPSANVRSHVNPGLVDASYTRPPD